MTSVYERDYVTVGKTADDAGQFKTHGRARGARGRPAARR